MSCTRVTAALFSTMQHSAETLQRVAPNIRGRLQTDGTPVARGAVDLAYKPLSVSYMSNGDYVLVAGTNNKVQMYTKDGVYLDVVASKKGWIWSCQARPGHNSILLGAEDGSITYKQITFSTVHGLYKDRYAHRDLMTDVVIQHLVNEQRVRIKCRDYVKRISVYDSRIAVQLPDRIIIYESAASQDGSSMQYKSLTRIDRRVECSLLVVTSQHITLCLDKKLQCINFEGVKVLEWVMESNIKYIKVLGGPVGREAVLVGLKDGQALKIFIDNPFPVPLWKHHSPLRCLDLSVNRTQLALVDDASRVQVIDLRTRQIKFEDEKASSAAFNTEYEDMIAYSGAGMLTVRTGSFSPHRQRMTGFVVAFEGSKVYCLHLLNMQGIDVPHSSALHSYIEKKDWATAYKIACLGATFEDWQQLGESALLDLNMDVARQALLRTQDLMLLNHVHRMETLLKSGLHHNILKAEVLAYQGKYDDAADLFSKAGATDRALEMWSDLRQFDKATKWAAQAGAGGPQAVEKLLQKQAQWNEEVRDYRAAAEMYMSTGKRDKAMLLLSKHTSDWSYLLEVARTLDRTTDEPALRIAANALLNNQQIGFAKEILLKIEDWPALIDLHVKAGAWPQAFMTVARCPSEEPALHERHALFLLQSDKFDEARQAYTKAGKPHLATQILEQLAESSVVQQSFAEAAYYLYQLAMEALASVSHAPPAASQKDTALLASFQELYSRAEVYYAYDIVHRNSGSPFQVEDSDTLFNALRFLTMRIAKATPPAGVSLSCILYELARCAEERHAWRLARVVYQRLQTLRIPSKWQAAVDVSTVRIRGAQSQESEPTQLCWRCGGHNSLVNSQGDECSSCGTPFIRSFVTFEALPVVQFELEAGISDAEAVRLLEANPLPRDSTNAPRPLRRDAIDGDILFGMEGEDDGADVLRLDDEDVHAMQPGGGGDQDDAFLTQMLMPNAPIVADRDMLRQLSVAEVLIRRWPNPALPAQYFRVVDPMSDVLLGDCGHFFEADEYEMSSLTSACRPFTSEPLPADPADS